MSRVSKTGRCALGETTIVLMTMLSMKSDDVNTNQQINVSATTTDLKSEGDVATIVCFFSCAY